MAFRPTDEQFIKCAIESYGDDDININQDIGVVSRSDTGAWVAAWIHIPDEWIDVYEMADDE